MTSKPSNLFILITIFIGIISVSTSSIFIRFASSDASSLAIAAYRLAFSIILLTPIVLTFYRKELFSIQFKYLIRGVGAGIFLSIHFATWISSLNYTSVASSVVLVSTTPLWVAILSPFILHEKVSKNIILGMLFSLAGGLIVGISDACQIQNSQLACPPITSFIQDTNFLGDMLALFGAWMAAGYIIVGRTLRSKVSLIPYVYVVYGTAAIALVLFLFFSHNKIIGFQPSTYLWLVLLAIIPQLIGHTTFNWALRFLPASLVSITMMGEPIGSTILAYVILKEKPTPFKIVGAIFILFGIYIASNVKSKTVDIPYKPTKN